MWSGVYYFARRAITELSKVFNKPLSELFIFLIILGAAGPRRPWLQDVIRDTRASAGHFKPEYWIFVIIHVRQLPCQRRIEQGARVLDAGTLADAIRSAHPASIHQPAVDAIMVDLALEQLCISRGMMHHERSAKAG